MNCAQLLAFFSLLVPRLMPEKFLDFSVVILAEFYFAVERFVKARENEEHCLQSGKWREMENSLLHKMHQTGILPEILSN